MGLFFLCMGEVGQWNIKLPIPEQIIWRRPKESLLIVRSAANKQCIRLSGMPRPLILLFFKGPLSRVSSKNDYSKSMLIAGNLSIP